MLLIVELAAVSVGQAVVKVIEDFAGADTLNLSKLLPHFLRTGKQRPGNRDESRMVLLHRTLVPLAPDPVLQEGSLVLDTMKGHRF